MKKSITGNYFITVLLLSFTGLFIYAAFNMVGTYRKYREQVASISENYIKEQESTFKYQVEKAVEDIEFRYRHGVGDSETIQRKLLLWLSQLRFPNQGKNLGFFFVRSIDGILLMSVSRPELVGKDVSNILDSEGNNLHERMLKVLNGNGGEGFLDYVWINPDSGYSEKKRSFIMEIPRWDAFVGAGFWFDDINSVIEERKLYLKKQLVNQALFSMFLMIGLALLTSMLTQIFRHRMEKQLNQFMVFFDKASSSAAKIDTDELEYTEFREMAVYANRMSEKWREAETNKQQALEQKEVLLKELYHRTKNNMQVISSLLNLKASEISNRALSGIFTEIQNKIYSMSMVHEKLYQSSDLKNIPLDEYITDLCSHLQNSYNSASVRSRFRYKLDKLPVSLDQALPLGLILTELVTNVIKHALPETGVTEIYVVLKKHESGLVNLEISDNGPGFPGGIDPSSTGTLGLQTIYALTETQLKGEVEFISSDGVTCRISFRN